LAEQANYLLVQSAQAPLHHVPYDPMVYGIVAVDEDVSEGNDSFAVGDLRGSRRIDSDQTPQGLADDLE